MFSILKYTAWLLTFGGFFGKWKPWRIPLTDFLEKKKFYRIDLHKLDKVDSKRCKKDFYKFLKLMKKRSYSLKNVPDIIRDSLPSRCSYLYELSNKDKKVHCEELMRNNILRYAVCDLKQVETIQSEFSSIMVLVHEVNNEEVFHRLWSLNKHNLHTIDKCQGDGFWENETCDCSVITTKGDCPACGNRTPPVSSKELKTYRKSINSLVDKVA